MVVYPAVVIHGLAEARDVLARGRPVSLFSAPGAGLYAGCGWWRALIVRARAEFPETPALAVLDCAHGAGQALAALRIGVVHLVLWPDAPGWPAVAAIARAKGGFLLDRLPPALDLARRGSIRMLDDWLQARSVTGDIWPELR
jgi:hypothetical protein